MSLIKTYLHKKMSDFHETALLKYEEEQDQLHREELEREQNPTKYWLITTSPAELQKASTCWQGLLEAAVIFLYIFSFLC